MGYLVQFFTVLLLIYTVTCIEFPLGIQKCHYGDSKCIIETTSNILTNFPGGIKEIGIPSIDPHFQEKLDLKRNLNGALNLQLSLRNSNLYGFSKAEILQLDGFEKDPKKLQMHIKIDRIEILGDYKLRGEFLLFPMTGEGKTNSSLRDLDLHWNGTVKLIEKNKEKYLKLENYKVRFTTNGISFYFDNLFGDDKALGKSANDFFNQNWRVFLDAMRPLLNKLIGQILGNLMIETFTKIPYKDLFLED